jgi:hypothetical protein
LRQPRHRIPNATTGICALSEIRYSPQAPGGTERACAIGVRPVGENGCRWEVARRRWPGVGLRFSPAQTGPKRTPLAASGCVQGLWACFGYEAVSVKSVISKIIARTRSGFRQSDRNMTEDYINVYGGYGIKLLRLQNELIQTFERYRRGNTQTVEVRYVHIHSGGQGVVGIINPTEDRAGGVTPRAREAEIAGIEIPQCSSVLPQREVLPFWSEARRDRQEESSCCWA